MKTSHLTSVVASLVFTLVGASSWGAGPPNNDVSDSFGNTAGGTNALVNNTPHDSAVGNGNTVFGAYTLHLNTTGSWNTAVGNKALFVNTSGGGNTATGEEALYSNTLGSYNTATGTLRR
jgi:hypothetical protein